MIPLAGKNFVAVTRKRSISIATGLMNYVHSPEVAGSHLSFQRMMKFITTLSS
jgi:superfamily I DNA and/or RNA helicase